jgi:hypothetical protein
MKSLKLVLVFLLFSFNLQLLAQYEYPGAEDSTAVKHKKGKYASSKIFLGGNLSLMIGEPTDIQINPIIGYMLTPRLSAGGGPMYMYYKYYDYKTNTWGIRFFGQFIVLKDLSKKININIGDIFIYAEDDILNYDPLYNIVGTNTYYTLNDNRQWIDIPLAGFGMRFPLGQKAAFSISCLWYLRSNLNFDNQGPSIRLGFNF